MVCVFSWWFFYGFEFFFTLSSSQMLIQAQKNYNHNLHFIFSLVKLEHMIRFEHNLVTFFIQGFIVALDNSMMIELDLIGE
jgi:hypothetical protein